MNKARSGESIATGRNGRGETLVVAACCRNGKERARKAKGERILSREATAFVVVKILLSVA